MNLKIVPIKFNKSFKDITPKKSKAIFEYDRLLNSNEPLALQIIIPEGIPHHKVIIKRFDYLTVSFNIGYNGRVGGMSPDDYRIRHTVKSILYYLVK